MFLFQSSATHLSSTHATRLERAAIQRIERLIEPGLVALQQCRSSRLWVRGQPIQPTTAELTRYEQQLVLVWSLAGTGRRCCLQSKSGQLCLRSVGTTGLVALAYHFVPAIKKHGLIEQASMISTSIMRITLTIHQHFTILSKKYILMC